jgi:hypothetical protein
MMLNGGSFPQYWRDLHDQILANTRALLEQTTRGLVDSASQRQEDAMRKLALALAAAALLTAMPVAVTTPASAAPLAAQADTMTDVSSRHWRHRHHWRHYGWHRGHHYGWRRHYGWHRPYHRPYYRASGYHRPYYW